jgi:hypothetical protein
VGLSRVAELSDGNDKRWNEDLIRQSFITIDAEEILKIKPSRRMDEDVLAWAPDKSGIYSVRYAYRLLKDEQLRLNTEKEGSSSTEGTWWKRLSCLKVPPKVRVVEGD